MSGRAYAEVIGDPIAQSKSPAIHQVWLQRAGLSADYRATRVESGRLQAYLNSRRTDADWLGCNVTMPHKQTVLPLLDRLSADAQRIGAVNTIVPDDGALVGHNTDAAGFLEPLQPVLAAQHLFRMARILGTGGAARAIAATLYDAGFALVLAGRNPDKAREILGELAPEGEHHAPPLDHFATPTEFAFDDREGCCDLVINASPLGMRGQPPLPFDWSHAPPGSIAYDIVTDPVQTPFLQSAQEAGFQTIDGYTMLIGQAAAAFALFFGAPPPRLPGDTDLRDLLAS
ncbi:Shikimate dehydrogenase [Alteripontixanthobacter maritimus]|uniref:Shikimate dehydrogenase (NADP(+)) n=1 Tax=Alteripontixanthobacter maritimus TaxID=2161824 RepID=A0A369QC55_9SPHN|nr:shikimate dehydrogenase [Alteripontixanthobacter maritimus]RDC61155.1 Shikimate dehydrogenase [Alteripontixanthobacter maritimus]